MVCTLLRVDTGQPFVKSAELVSNDDGSVSFLLPDNTTYAGQEPNAYGVRNDNTSKASYQRATLKGSVVTFVPRPGDLPCAYLIGEGRSY